MAQFCSIRLLIFQPFTLNAKPCNMCICLPRPEALLNGQPCKMFRTASRWRVSASILSAAGTLGPLPWSPKHSRAEEVSCGRVGFGAEALGFLGFYV